LTLRLADYLRLLPYKTFKEREFMITATKTTPAIEAKTEAITFERIRIDLREKIIVYEPVFGGQVIRVLSEEVMAALETAFVAELAKDANYKDVAKVVANVEDKLN
jgi:hypothetical protein